MTRLAELVDMTFGFAFKSAEFTEAADDIRLLRGDNIAQGKLRWDGAKRFPADRSAEVDKYSLARGDVVLAMDRPWIEAGLKYSVVRDADLPSLLVQRVARLRAQPALDQGYLAAIIGSRAFMSYIVGTQTGSAVPHISGGQIGDFEVAVLPPLPEQRAIAATLGALDDKIESNRRVVSRALSLARALVDRAAADRPKMTYRDNIEVLMGSAFRGDAFSTPGVGRPLLRIRDLKTFEPQTWTTETRKDETVIHAGDIVVGMDAEFRATLWLGNDAVLNQRVCSFRGRGEVGRAFVLAALEPELEFHEQAKTGTTVIHLNKADIDTFTVPALSPPEHKALADETEPLIDIAVARSLENRQLALTRDALLPELLSGRIRVPVEEPAA